MKEIKEIIISSENKIREDIKWKKVYYL
jgi:hypothetical protein